MKYKDIVQDRIANALQMIVIAQKELNNQTLSPQEFVTRLEIIRLNLVNVEELISLE